MLEFSRLLEPATAARLLQVVDDGTTLPVWLIEECARALDVAPAFFVEWRLAQTWQYDVRKVGDETAMANLAAWAKDQRRA